MIWQMMQRCGLCDRQDYHLSVSTTVCVCVSVAVHVCMCVCLEASSLYVRKRESLHMCLIVHVCVRVWVCVCAYRMHMSFHRCCYLTGSFSCVHTNPPKTKAESEKEMEEEWLLTKTTETTNTNRLSTILNKRFFLSVCLEWAYTPKLTVEKTPVWKDSGYWCRSNGDLMRAHSRWNVLWVLIFFFKTLCVYMWTLLLPRFHLSQSVERGPSSLARIQIISQKLKCLPLQTYFRQKIKSSGISTFLLDKMPQNVSQQA